MKKKYSIVIVCFSLIILDWLYYYYMYYKICDVYGPLIEQYVKKKLWPMSLLY